ncbi:hypothetical protein E4U41_000468 [Claviceps citrina]|nr:hypothetical protein E4U41_000468 [Claviceps citrina]
MALGRAAAKNGSVHNSDPGCLNKVVELMTLFRVLFLEQDPGHPIVAEKIDAGFNEIRYLEICARGLLDTRLRPHDATCRPPKFIKCWCSRNEKSLGEVSAC